MPKIFRQTARRYLMKKLKLLDTFSGIGGFSYAAEKLVGGFETTQFIEIEPYCQKVLKKHWPNVPIHDDIKTFTAKPFQYDAICGGFPCQDISVAGQGKGITKESRSGLFYELMRVIRMVRPKYVILENVAAILNNGLDIVLGELAEAGFDCEWACISASSLGACHRRSRWWLVAYSNDNGSSSSEESRSIEKTDGGAEKRKDETCQSQRSSESTDSKNFQQSSSNSESKRAWKHESRLWGQSQGGDMQTDRDSNEKISNATHSNSNGHKEGCTKTRNKITPGQDTSGKWSTNTSDFERCSDDGKDKRESRIDDNLSGSSDGGEATSSETGGICKLSERTNDNQGTNRKNNNKKDNDRTLVSQGQSRVQFSQHRELGRDQTTLENNSIQQGDDNSKNKGMDNQKPDAPYSQIIRMEGMRPSGQQVQSRLGKEKLFKWSYQRDLLSPDWRAYASEPVLRRRDDGLSDRTHRLKALGNSIVPQCAAIPLQRVLDLENE